MSRQGVFVISDVRERAEAVEQWANLNGDQLEAFWPDDETRWVIENALWCAGDVLNLLAAVLPDERDGRREGADA